MYAVISDGSHQYRVEVGQVFETQRKDLPDDAKTLDFDRILMVGGTEDDLKIGTPVVEGAKVVASIIGEVKADKIVVQKFRRRKGYRRKQGHRQKHLRVRIESIEA